MLDAIILSGETLRGDHMAQSCLSWLEAHRPEAAERLYRELPEAAKDELDSPPSVLDPQSWWCSEEAAEWWEDTLRVVMEEAQSKLALHLSFVHTCKTPVNIKSTPISRKVSFDLAFDLGRSSRVLSASLFYRF